ncbi:hypothetical protein FG386_001470 [Cryptosporidium ryanae]|uniref:uncharacterized protein n=1 Tax=Cryptosporidium ryanae TaxID=515981 RepID=UPI00351A85A2|nr:hypothetical protein FG386_001470 [Cryptosporidium ryanae]
MIINENNLNKLLELRRNIEYLLTEAEHRYGLLLNENEDSGNTSDSLMLGNIAYLGLRYSSTTRAPPNYNDLTGKELSKTPSYRFPCPTTALIQLSQLYNAKPLICMKPEIIVDEASFDSKTVVISCPQKGVEITYQINNSGEQFYFEPFHIKGPGEYNITAFSKKNGFRKSDTVTMNFNIHDHLNDSSIYLPPASPDAKCDTTINAKNNLISDKQDITMTENKNTRKQHTHTSKYKGLHLTRVPVLSDDDDEDSDDNIDENVKSNDCANDSVV